MDDKKKTRKIYEEPVMEIVRIEYKEDILATSNGSKESNIGNWGASFNTDEDW